MAHTNDQKQPYSKGKLPKKSSKPGSTRDTTPTTVNKSAEERTEEQRKYRNPQSDRKREIVKETYARYNEMKDARNKRHRYFNDRTLVELIDDSTKRFNLFQRPRSHAEDWQTTYVGAQTRNKVMAILARIAAQRMKRSYYGVPEDNKWKARICRAMDEWAAYKNGDDMQSFFEMLSAATKGTVVGYESYHAPMTKYYDVTGYEPSTGEIKFEEKSRREFNDVFGEIVPLEEFYPGSLRTIHINGPKGMMDAGRERFVSHAEFQKMWGKYPDAHLVKPGGEARANPFFKEFIPGECAEDEVWIFEYYKRPGHTPDAMNIMANGILLTPEVSPLPWNHKTQERGLPFWVGGMEPYAEDFFYRMPIPIKLKGDQDGQDSVMRMSVDILHLFLNKPIITNDPEDIEEKTLAPGVVFEVDDPATGYREMNIGGPGQEAQNFLRIFANNISLSSVDNVTQGSAGSEATATEIDAAQQGALELLTLFNSFMEWATVEKGQLRIANQIQFYPMAIGKEDDGAPKFRKLRVDNVPRILSGRNGSVCLYFVATKSSLPGGAVDLTDLQKSQLAEMYGDDFDEIVVKVDDNDPELEHVYVTAKFMRGFTAGVRAIANSSVKMSENYIRAHEKEFQTWAIANFGDMLDRGKMFRSFAESYDKDPDELLIDQSQMQGGAEAEQDPEMAALGIDTSQDGASANPDDLPAPGGQYGQILGNQRAGQGGAPPTPPTGGSMPEMLRQ